ncbi:MAG: WbqC family protein [Candidatus Lustribacter sp.]
MIVSIAQPAYWMWSGLVARIASSDLHVVLDNVDHSKGSFTNRNRIRTREGWQWLTVPLRGGSSFFGKPIRSLPVDNSGNWRAKHLASLEHAYVRAPYFAPYRAALRELYAREYETIAEVCAATTALTLDGFGVRTPLRSSSDLGMTRSKSELVLDICLAVGATTYLSGPFGRDYLDREAFARHGIAVTFDEFVHPEYPQSAGGPFEPNMAAIDLLFNCGPGARDVLDTGRRPALST